MTVSASVCVSINLNFCLRVQVHNCLYHLTINIENLIYTFKRYVYQCGDGALSRLIVTNSLNIFYLHRLLPQTYWLITLHIHFNVLSVKHNQDIIAMMNIITVSITQIDEEHSLRNMWCMLLRFQINNGVILSTLILSTSPDY